ncbi:hypothetical protein [Pseudomonas syringae]|uniref:hypothetical protein n=1 Tax=Pseudomonas syringae TaxID=317 RepID=UPI0013C2B1C3|nr:hypothetical protein [Pseudomonas syringae]
MATRRKRQTNILHDQTSGTVTLSHGSSSKPQNTGFLEAALLILEPLAVNAEGGVYGREHNSKQRRLKPMLKLKRRQSVGLQKMQQLKQEPRQKPQNEHVLKRRYAHRPKKIRHIDRLLKR